MLRFFSFGIAFAISGCGLAQQAHFNQEKNLAYNRFDAASAECTKQFPDKTRKPVVPRIKCFNAAWEQLAQHDARVTGSREGPLLYAKLAKDVVTGERFDAGKMTEAEFLATMAESNANYAAGSTQRANDAAAVQAAQNQAAAAQSQAAMANQRAIADAFKPKTTTCNSYGNTVTCY